MNPVGTASIPEAVERLAGWLSAPGAGSALVEFVSARARRDVLAKASGIAGVTVAEIEFSSSSSNVEQAVWGVVERLLQSSEVAVSLHGLEAAFPEGESLEKAIDLLGFLRETLARFQGKQIWWVTMETARVLRERAPDWLSWMSPRIAIHDVKEPVDAGNVVLSEHNENLDSARRMARDALERMEAGLRSGGEIWEVWAESATPALMALSRAGSLEEARQFRATSIDLLYGPARDARRLQKIRADFDELLRRDKYAQAAMLAGEGEELHIAGAATERQIDDLLAAGSALLMAGLHDQAERVLKTALDAAESGLGGQHRTTLKVVETLAAHFAMQGRIEEAGQAYSKVLDGLSRLGLADSEEAVGPLHGLAQVEARKGRLGKAEILHRRALHISARRYDPEHPITLQVMSSLGGLFIQLGRLEEAERMLTHALHGIEAAMGSDRSLTLPVLIRLGHLYARQGRSGQAESAFQEAIRRGEKGLGAEHPDTLRAVGNLAQFYETAGRFTEVEPLLARIAMGFEKVYGAKHPNTVEAAGALEAIRRQIEGIR